MTDKELKKRLKKLIIGFVVVVILIGILVWYTLGNNKTELSLYANAEGYTEKMQALGINEEEFREYLSLFGNLVDSNYSENQKTLNMVTNFIESMYASYEMQTDENGLKTYDANLVNQIATEMQGAYIKQYIEDGEIYDFEKETNCYKQKQDLNQTNYCTEIKEILKNEDKIEVTYCLTRMTKEQMAEYMTGKNLDLESHTIKAILMHNSEYEYAKYFVSSIEEIE